MTRIKSDCVAYIIVFSLIFALPLLSHAQNIADRKPLVLASAEITKQTVKNENNPVKEENETDAQKEESSFFNFKSNSNPAKQNQTSEDKQDMMEKALDLLEVADKLWENGDIENTLDTLDQAYALLLNANGDVAIAQEKDDLRLLISKRILAVYSSKKTLLKGKNSEIPLIMNTDVEKEISSFQGLERDNFIAAYQRSGMYRSVIVRALKKAGIPEEFFWLPLVESFFKINAYSRARALGLWQFIPSTGYKFGLNRDEWIDERMDVEKSTQAAIAYLKELHNMFGDWLTVLAAYNCGEGRVLRVISRQNINYLDGFWDLYRQLPHETARYVPRLLATLHIVKNPQKYGFDLNTIEKPINFETVKVNKIMKLKDIAEKTGTSEEELNLLNSELRFKLTPDHEYELKLPKESLEKFNLVANEIPQSEKPRSVSVRTVFIKHRVRKGETIASIANKYDVPSSVIISYNKLSSKKKLVQGKRLKIPITREKHFAASGSSRQKDYKIKIASSGRYKVRKGETLSMIARRFSIPSSQIKELNNLKTDKICAGQTLKLPQKRADSDLEDKNDQADKKSVKNSKINKEVLSATDIDKLGANKYIVTKNDNLHSIAKKNGINLAKLMELNKISINEKIVPGQILILK
ncbi:MAG: LysM peptidoglycan-binding domain-containing protein [Deltaproteobacteria bacterium]|nr:LysM peptidoglycan-binding domain-containing protein [Deltaproteobacteria bacterium]